MKAYRVTKVWSALNGTRWELVREDENYPARIYPFTSFEDARDYAVENEIPFYDFD